MILKDNLSSKVLIVIMMFLLCAFLGATEKNNLDNENSENHLMFLRREFKVEDDNAIGYVIYADAKGGGFVHADAPGEGIVCVDDTARAGIYFLRRYEEYLNKDYEKALIYKKLALETIEFCQLLRTKEGDYYNFCFEDGRINKNGITSRPSKSWWALRALWLISEALNILSADEDFDNDYFYHQAMMTTLLFKSELDDEGLIRDYSDLSSLYLISLANLYKHSNDSQLISILNTVANGIIKKQKDIIFDGIIDEGKEDFVFHSWGSRQVQALSMAYQVTDNPNYYKAACKMADCLYPHMINMGPFYEYQSSNVVLFPQIAYGTEAAVSSLYYLYKAGGEEKYAYMMALLNGFFHGNNHLNRKMFGSNGEGFDGLESVFINKNAGAESTISYLLSASLIDRIPEKIAKYSLIVPLIKSSSILLKTENMNAGLSNVQTRLENGLSGMAGTSFKLKDTPDVVPGVYLAYLLGKRLMGGNCRVYLSKSSSFVDVIEQESPVFLGFLEKPEAEKEIESKIMLSAKFAHEAFITQLLLIPSIEYQIYTEPTSSKQKLWAYNCSKDPVMFNMYGLETEIKPLSFLFSDINVPIEIKGHTEETERFSPRIVHAKNYEVNMIDLSPLVNNNGIGMPMNPANFDNFGGSKGAYYPEDLIKKRLEEGILIHDRLAFLFTVDGDYDNVVTNGQEIEINRQAEYLYILGSCDHGAFSGELEIVYEENTGTSSDYMQLSFPDWCDSGVKKDIVALELSYRYNSQDLNEWINPKIYIQKIPLKDKKIASITFPVIPTMHIFAVSISN